MKVSVPGRAQELRVDRPGSREGLDLGAPEMEQVRRRDSSCESGEKSRCDSNRRKSSGDQDRGPRAGSRWRKILSLAPDGKAQQP